MREFWRTIDNTDSIERGMFVILPLKYDGKMNQIEQSILKNSEFRIEEFDSSDFAELLSKKCKKGDFVQRYKVDINIENIRIDKGISVTDIQLFVFNNGIAFLSVYLSYTNDKVFSIYKFVNPGYVDDNEQSKIAQETLLKNISEQILRKIKPEVNWFATDEISKNFIIKEGYRLNVTSVPNRFHKTETINRITYNQHRIIDITRDFEDKSEMDVAYVTGARDVDDEKYGWGCAITSQEVSYAYAPEHGKSKPITGDALKGRAYEDLLLTILVMYQKYMCMLLNEEIHKRYTAKKTTMVFNKSIQDLKKEALEFIAYGTIAPSQISRWSNVCETYRLLQEMNGVNEALTEIGEKINLLNEEQERINSKREYSISMLIAVFGLISIIASILQIVDYVSSGKSVMLISFAASLAGVCVFGMILVILMAYRRKRKGDV